jgi:hypothetical protein
VIQEAAHAVSVDDAIAYIENRFSDTDATLKTDIRILVAAIRHVVRQRKSSG